MMAVVQALQRGEGRESRAEVGPERLAGPFGRLADQGCALGTHLLNRLESGTGRWEKPEPRPRPLNLSGPEMPSPDSYTGPWLSFDCGRHPTAAVRLPLLRERIFFILVSLQQNKEDVSMLAKLTSKNQLTLPKALVSAFQGTEYFDVTHENGRLVLTPVRLTRATAVRAKLAELGLSETDVAEAVAWARQAQ